MTGGERFFFPPAAADGRGRAAAAERNAAAGRAAAQLRRPCVLLAREDSVASVSPARSSRPAPPRPAARPSNGLRIRVCPRRLRLSGAEMRTGRRVVGASPPASFCLLFCVAGGRVCGTFKRTCACPWVRLVAPSSCFHHSCLKLLFVCFSCHMTVMLRRPLGPPRRARHVEAHSRVFLRFSVTALSRSLTLVVTCSRNRKLPLGRPSRRTFLLLLLLCQ